MPAHERDFDVILVGMYYYDLQLFIYCKFVYINYQYLDIGGLNSVALTKFLQTDGVNYKMAIITNESRGKFVKPENYWSITHEHLKPIGMNTGAVSA